MALLAVALFSAIAPAIAKKAKAEPPIPSAVDAIGFAELDQSIRTGLDEGGRYAFVPNRERPILLEQLRVIGDLLGKGASAELSKDEQIRLFNAQEKANGILLRYDGDRLICERVYPTGSHRPQTVCKTYAEKRRSAEQAERMIQDMNRQDLPKGN